MKIEHLVQGSDAWHQFRLEHFGASEAAVVLGLSKTVTRNELLRMKHSGLAREFSDWVQRNVLDKGHEFEAEARPHVEAFIGDDLYAVTCSDGLLSASCDGLTLGGEIAWEHKQHNAELFAQVSAGVVPDEHMPQCQQVLMVTGAQKLIFTCSDGTPEHMAHVEVLPDPRWFSRILAGWEQFEKDLESAPPERAPLAAVAAPVESLPAVLVRMTGALTIESNLDAFGKALHAFIDKIPEKPTTDQQFADTDAACKALKKAEEALKAEEDRALAGMADVEQMRRIVADLRDLARKTRLAREKMVEARKTEIRLEEIQRGKTVIAAHIAGLNDALGKPYMPASKVDFALAIKGLRSLDSVRAAIDQAIADAKIEASATQQRIMANLKRLQDAGHPMLFADMASLVLKDADDLSAIIASRIAQHEAAEAKRLESERERIRAEEQEKARREAAEAQRIESARVAAEQEKARLVADSEARLKAKEEAAENAAREAKERAEAKRMAEEAASVKYAHLAEEFEREFEREESEEPTLKLGAICELLGFTMTSAFVESLGIKPAKVDGASKLYRQIDFVRICSALISHISAASETQFSGEKV